jgi:coenzyme PQQ precursor peptide PqqA
MCAAVQYSFHARRDAVQERRTQPLQERDMNWQTPKATDLRFGFEITMYIANR